MRMASRHTTLFQPLYEIESSSESKSVEEASANSSEEEQQPALRNAQNDTQAEDVVVRLLPHYEVTQQRS